MSRFISLFCYLVVALGLFGGSAVAAEPVSDISNLLVGTKYEHLIAEARKSPVAGVSDKGFLPSFGNYFDDANPGWGLDIQRLGNSIFAVWFTYNLDGTPTWFIIVGELDGMSVTGNIESFKWDRFGDPGEQATVSVRGTMTIAWSNTSDATASWTLDGESGSAPVSFTQFALPPTLANMTGHYYDVMRPGWGYTLLTQGTVTVMTMYWYKDGQPVWAQGVSPDLGFTQVFELLYFLGPGLCPSCLSSKGGGPTTTELASLTVDWAATTMPAGGGSVTAAPISYIYETVGIFSAKGGPLGANPFDEILIPNTTQAITSVFQDNYDPEYEWFFGLLPNKGNDCLPFQYDPGIVDFPAELTGLSGTAYIGTDEADDDGRLRVYSDPGCTTRFTFPTFNGPGETSLLMAPTLQSGVAVIWKATVPPPPTGKGSGGGAVTDEVRVLMAAGIFSLGPGLAMCMYGMATAQYFAIYEVLALLFVFYSVFPPIIFPPQLATILSDPCTAATVMLILLAASG